MTSTLRRTVRAAAISTTIALGATGVLLVTAPAASACQPESCPAPSPVCAVLASQPKLPHCIPVY